MRIRSIKPEFWRSEDVTALDWEARLLYIGLWSYVDDNGVGLDKLVSITADLFAGDLEHDAPETFARVSRGLETLVRTGRVHRYEVDGKRYIYVNNWKKHQRIDKPNKPRYPLPASENAELVLEFPEPSRQSRETPATGTEEQGNRGTKTLSNPRLDKRHLEAKFDEFWSVYPRREAKKGSLASFTRAVKAGADPDAVIAGAKRYAAYLAAVGRTKELTKLPTTWLNQGCWEDELSTGAVTASVVPMGDHRAWLNELWRTGDVASICNVTSLRYEQPDLPDHVTTKQDAEKFFHEHRRSWIKDHGTEILNQLQHEEAA